MPETGIGTLVRFSNLTGNPVNLVLGLYHLYIWSLDNRLSIIVIGHINNICHIKHMTKGATDTWVRIA